MSIRVVDIVNRKLAEFERKNRTFRQLYEQTAYANPLLFAAAGMITGITIQNFLDISLILFIFAAGMLSAALLCLVFLRYRYNLKSIIYISSLFMGICFALLGAYRLKMYRTPPARDIVNFVDNDRTLATVKGIVLTKPEAYKSQWVFGELSYTDPPSGFLMRVKQVKTENSFAKVNGKLTVYVKEPVIHITPGDYVQIHCWLEHLNEPSNPGQFNYAEFMKRKNVHITAAVRTHNAIKVISSPESSLPLKIKYGITSRINNILFSNQPWQNPHRGVLAALLLGNRSDIDKETYANFRKTGLLHFISLSGLHMGILIASVWFVCRRIGFLEKSAAAICLLVILVFCITVPLRSATFRAAIIAAMFCFACFFARKPSPLNTLSLAAIILILIRPTCVFEPGWQLSFACVTGILLFSERINNFLLAPREKIFPPDRFKTFIRKATAIPIVLLAVGVSAWLGAAGILLYHFHTLTPLAPLWTVIVFPFIALITDRYAPPAYKLNLEPRNRRDTVRKSPPRSYNLLLFHDSLIRIRPVYKAWNKTPSCRLCCTDSSGGSIYH
jgi:competence protein ComEC